MTTKRITACLLFALCALTAAAQDALVFTPDAWDFGTIRETDGRVSHTFTGVNRGGKPLVILDVVTSCGCTVPEFSRKPVAPGGRTEITVTYDPANRPGAFTKELGVYSTERKKIAVLTVRGTVTPRTKSVEELYPIDAGGSVRLSSTLCAFTYIYPGRRVHSSVGVVNTSSRPVRLQLLPKSESGLLETDYPRVLNPGERGEIGLSYLIPAGKPRYGTLRDALEVVADGRGTGTLVVAHAIGADDPAGIEKEQAPKSEVSRNILKFGPLKRSDSPQKLSFTLSNTGGGELIVRAVEGDGKAATTLRPGQRIPPGGSLEVAVTLDPAAQPYGILTDRLMLITNDPDRPMRRLRITAVIEE